MKKWLGRLGRLMLLVIAVVISYLAATLVASCLAPQPVFEIPMQAGESANLLHNVLSIQQGYKTLRSYRLSDGALLDTTNFRRAAAIKHPLAGTDAPCTTPYFVEEYSVRGTNDSAFMLFDPTTGEGFQFLRYRNSLAIQIEVEKQRPTQAYLVGQPIPLHYLGGLSGALTMTAHFNKFPRQIPQLIHVVSLPNNKVSSSFILDPEWGLSNLRVSPTGRYVACVREEMRYQKLTTTWPAWQRVWDTKLSRWIQLESDLIEKAEFFVNDEVLVGRACRPTKRQSNAGIQFVNARTGKMIDYLPAPPHYSIYRKDVYASGDEYYYLKWREVEPQRFHPALTKANSERAEEIQTLEIREQWSDVMMVAGLQTVYASYPAWKRWLLSDNMFKLPQWIYTLPFLQYQTTYVHDWNNNQSIPVWSGFHQSYRNHDGTYLLVVQGQQVYGKGDLAVNGSAQIFHMPLVLYSAWWHRGAGLAVLVMLVFCYRVFLHPWYVRTRQHLTSVVT
jgi:hypothetical protein